MARINKIGVLALIFTLLLSVQSPAQEHPISETEKKIQTISGEEGEILAQLYTMSQELDEMTTGLEGLAEEIAAIQREIQVMGASIQKAQSDYDGQKEALRRVLLTYQKMGPESFFEIVLNSQSLSDFLNRLNTLRDLSANTKNLLEEIDAAKLVVEAEKARKELILGEFEVKLSAQSAAKAEKEQKKSEMETYLASLQDQRATYEAYLTALTQAWTRLLPLFAEATDRFAKVIETGNFPPDAISISFTSTGLLGVLSEETFNEMVHSQKQLEGMEFAFTPDGINLDVEAEKLKLQGHFIIDQGDTLIYVAESGSFYDLPLSSNSIEALFEQGRLEMDLEPILAGSRIEKIEEDDDRLSLTINLGLNQ